MTETVPEEPAPGVPGLDWNALMRRAGRCVGRWQRRREAPLLRHAAGHAAREARRTWVQLTAAAATVLYAWVGIILAAAAQQILRFSSLLPLLAGGIGGVLAGSLRGRDRLRVLEGKPPMRAPWAPTAVWLAALAGCVAAVSSLQP